MFQNSNRQPYQRRPVARRTQRPPTRQPVTMHVAQHGRDNLDCGAKGTPHDIPDPLMAEMVPEIRDELGAILNCFLGLVEDFLTDSMVGVDVGGQGVVVYCEVEDGPVDLLQTDEVAASEEEFEVLVP